MKRKSFIIIASVLIIIAIAVTALVMSREKEHYNLRYLGSSESDRGNFYYVEYLPTGQQGWISANGWQIVTVSDGTQYLVK